MIKPGYFLIFLIFLTQIKGNLYCTGNQNNRPARSGQPEERKKKKRWPGYLMI
jgi:hypothetical protein